MANLEARIEAAGFVTILSRGSQPPKQYFQHRRHGTQTLAEVYGELLTPRRGKEDSGPVELCPGFSATALPYLGLLLEDPILLVCPPDNAVGLPPGSRVRLPQPLWFVMQKILMRRCASPMQGDKRDKDFAAVYEVVRLFSGEWESWASRLRNALEEAPMPAKWFRDFERRARESFGSAEARGCLGVARIHERSPRLPEFEETTVAAVMAKLFRTLWPFPA